MEVKFVKLRDTAKLPYKKHLHDAGYDLSWAPDARIHTSENIVSGYDFFDKDEIMCKNIWPGQSYILSTGLKAIFPPGYVLEIKNRSGMASNKQLIVGAHIVDSTYRGEIFVNLHNIGKDVQIIKEGDRIAQCIFYKVEYILATEISEEEYAKYSTDRGDGALGSTGK